MEIFQIGRLPKGNAYTHQVLRNAPSKVHPPDMLTQPLNHTLEGNLFSNRSPAFCGRPLSCQVLHHLNSHQCHPYWRRPRRRSLTSHSKAAGLMSNSGTVVATLSLNRSKRPSTPDLLAERHGSRIRLPYPWLILHCSHRFRMTLSWTD